jgi:hypothetical protein
MIVTIPHREFYERGFVCITSERFLGEKPTHTLDLEALRNLDLIFPPEECIYSVGTTVAGAPAFVAQAQPTTTEDEWEQEPDYLMAYYLGQAM